MTVSAQVDKIVSFSDKADLVEMRSGGSQSAGSYTYEGSELITTWHAHDLHQLEYAFHGTVEVETTTAHYLLPPQQAAWIPSGVDHRTTIRTTVRTISVFFEPHLVPVPGERVRIVAVPPVLREMIIYSGRWAISRSCSDPVADVYFNTLGRLVSEALESETPLFLPTSTDPVVARALAWTERTSTPQAWERSPVMSGSPSAHSDAASRRDWACRGGIPDPSSLAAGNGPPC